MEYNNTKIFEAITDFVNDLKIVFGTTGKTPLDLYCRLVTHASKPGSDVEKFVAGFKVFYYNYDTSLLSFEDFVKIPKGTVIRYGNNDNIFIEIQKYIYKLKTNKEQLEVIRKHLLTISALIDPNEKTLESLNSATPILEKMGIKGSSKEAQLVANMFSKAKKAVQDTNSDDPAQVIMGLLSSGMLPDMINSIQAGVTDKTIDVNKLIPMMTNGLTNMMKNDSEDIEEENGKLDVDKLLLHCQLAVNTDAITEISDEEQ